ncbi:MAG: EscU/YscU/HrcU family type III secretion system export apparatus switch protein, partial [Treponema sp.]|nr:EscU/YscU/HrcU family type III secretion system export apparatus switch protein [Treponema sp.]
MNLPKILYLIQISNVYGAVGKIASTAATILVASAIIFIAIAIPDYFVQKKQFMERMKMTKQEVKQEFKEMEGDPEVKARLNQAQRELLQKNIPQQVEKSDVVITNPTHYAVALYYDKILKTAPQVMAKGADELAIHIKNIARQKNVPIVENRPLARALYSQVEIGATIPETYFTALATIYAKLSEIKKK